MAALALSERSEHHLVTLHGGRMSAHLSSRPRYRPRPLRTASRSVKRGAGLLDLGLHRRALSLKEVCWPHCVSRLLPDPVCKMGAESDTRSTMAWGETRGDA